MPNYWNSWAFLKNNYNILMKNINTKIKTIY